MIEELKKEIEVEKEVLSTLPKNNKKNIEKYKNSVSEEIEKYKIRQKEVVQEMQNRKENIANKLPNEETNDRTSELDNILKECHWFSSYNTSYEKMQFDEILYKLHKDKITYESINEIIHSLIEKYKEAGISLSLNDFSYSPIFYEYMKVFFANLNDLSSKNLSLAFEKLYWKESNITTHIELTFKALYYKYQSFFDKYCLVKKQTLTKEFNNSIAKQYGQVKQDCDDQKTNIVNIYNKFVNKELNPGDFTKEKIEGVLGNYIDVSKINEENYESIMQEFIKLKHTLEEYSYLLKYNYILDDVKKLYAEKDKYKGIVKTKLGEIKKSEQKLEDLSKRIYLLNKEKQVKLGFLYKLTKSMWSSKNKDHKDEIIDKLNMDIDNQIMEIKKLYDEFEMDKFNEKLLLFNDNSEIISLFELANSYYIYQDKLLEEQELETDKVIREVNQFILNPYNNLINNINIENNKDIKQIISDKYELSGINISTSSLEDVSTIDGIISDIDKIVYYNVINKSNLSVEEILYVYNIDNILN